MYGSSTTKTPVIISGCSMGGQIEVSFENSSFSVENFELLEFNNTIRNA